MSEDVTDIEPLRADLAYLKEAFREVHTAIIGDDRLGHKGLVSRLADLETVEKQIPEVHGAIETRRLEGDRRLHERIDTLEKDLTGQLAKLTQEVKTSKAYLVGVGIGASLLGGGTAWGIFQATGG